MSNLIRWEPMPDMITLREAMDRLFDDAFTRPVGLGEDWQMPAVNLYQTDNEVVVQAMIPGLKESDVHISLTGDVLTIKGEYKEEAETKDKVFSIREQRVGTFVRSLRLPADVIHDKSKAEFENGILTITLPKAEEIHPKTITIKTR